MVGSRHSKSLRKFYKVTDSLRFRYKTAAKDQDPEKLELGTCLIAYYHSEQSY